MSNQTSYKKIDIYLLLEEKYDRTLVSQITSTRVKIQNSTV